MAWDDRLAQRMRGDLADEPVIERKMFGGLAFLRSGHMVCGLHRGGAMFRVGRPSEAAALALPGVTRMAMSGRPMSGMVTAAAGDLRDDALRAALTARPLGFVKTLPPK